MNKNNLLIVNLVCSFIAFCAVILVSITESPALLLVRIIGTIAVVINISITTEFYAIITKVKQQRKKRKAEINARYEKAKKYVVFCTDDSPKAIAKYKTYYATPRLSKQGKK